MGCLDGAGPALASVGEEERKRAATDAQARHRRQVGPARLPDAPRAANSAAAIVLTYSKGKPLGSPTAAIDKSEADRTRLHADPEPVLSGQCERFTCHAWGAGHDPGNALRRARARPAHGDAEAGRHGLSGGSVEP